MGCCRTCFQCAGYRNIHASFRIRLDICIIRREFDSSIVKILDRAAVSGGRNVNNRIQLFDPLRIGDLNAVLINCEHN